MKALIAVIVLASSIAHADMEFTKGGTAHPTDAANGVALRGQDALIMFNSLNARIKKSDGYLEKFVSLDGGMPATRSFISCSIAEGASDLGQLKSAECYMGKIK